MGKQLSDGEGRREMRGRPWLGFVVLLLLLAAAGCADTSAGSDNDKRGVFYGGLSGGHAWP